MGGRPLLRGGRPPLGGGGRPPLGGPLLDPRGGGPLEANLPRGGGPLPSGLRSGGPLPNELRGGGPLELTGPTRHYYHRLQDPPKSSFAFMSARSVRIRSSYSFVC